LLSANLSTLEMWVGPADFDTLSGGPVEKAIGGKLESPSVSQFKTIGMLIVGGYFVPTNASLEQSALSQTRAKDLFGFLLTQS